MPDDKREVQDFGPDERLRLQQLRILEWLAERTAPQGKSGSGKRSPRDEGETWTVPERWQLTKGYELYQWQRECVEKWFAEGHRGTVKVVTGAGKTLLAFAIAEQLQNKQVPGLHMAIVVPTIVLMNQWYEEFREKGNIPDEAIARMGGGYKENYQGGKRILISVLASARKFLKEVVDKSNTQDTLFFIVDECHRIGAAEMSQVLATQRRFNLGLSATPERDEDESPSEDNEAYDTSQTGKQLGRIIYELTYADALRMGIIPPFTIHHYGVPLNEPEKQSYDSLTRIVNDTKAELKSLAPQDASSGPAFYRWARAMGSKKGSVSELANKLNANIAARKAVLYSMESRYLAVEDILRREFSENPGARVILFHERIDEAMKLFGRLIKSGFAAVAENGELPDSIREENLELFRKGIARVMVSVKSLIEGFNVPAVDVGIIVASTSSVRQRIQSMGRVLRRHRTAGGEEKTSCIYILYASDTVDDFIYSKMNWEHATGLDRNIYYRWDFEKGAVRQEGPPRAPLPTDKEIDASLLSPGGVYPGAYDGAEYTADTAMNIRNEGGQYTFDAELSQAIMRIKGSAGRFRVTPNRLYVLVRVPDPEEEWVTRYVTTLSHPLSFDIADRSQPIGSNIDEWILQAQAGDVYPSAEAPVDALQVFFRQKKGGVISVKIPNGEVYARVGTKAKDPVKGRDAQRLVEVAKRLVQRGESVSRLEVNARGHVLYRFQGQLKFVCALEAGLEFPEQGDRVEGATSEGSV